MLAVCVTGMSVASERTGAGSGEVDVGEIGDALSFFEYLGSMVEDEEEGWIDPLDLDDGYRDVNVKLDEPLVDIDPAVQEVR